MISQMEFPLIALHFPAGTQKLRVKPQTHPNPHPDPVILSTALIAENISFITFTILLALHRNKAPMPIARIARTTGQSYFAVRSQILNTIYFTFLPPAKKSPLANALASAALNSEAETKLARIEKRLAQ